MIQDLTYFRTFWGHYNLPIWNKDSGSSIWQFWLGGFKSGIKNQIDIVVFKRILWYLLTCVGEPTKFGHIFTKGTYSNLTYKKSTNNESFAVSEKISRISYQDILWLEPVCCKKLQKIVPDHTANVCRELQGLYREIGVQGF